MKINIKELFQIHNKMQPMILNKIFLLHKILFEQLVKLKWSLRIDNLICQCQRPDFNNSYSVTVQENVLVYKNCILKRLGEIDGASQWQLIRWFWGKTSS